ncbi:hypothetical protein DFH09DRAFT_1362974 [Mycena vulgaris]|nr:hypothetical protein DFH09DRAFT_1362974 [Mycena vulgaris]
MSTASSSPSTRRYSSAPFSVSQTFTGDPVPSPPALPTGGPPADPNANSGPKSSAQLYLYTFLATLILLLGVSSAIQSSPHPLRPLPVHPSSSLSRTALSAQTSATSQSQAILLLPFFHSIPRTPTPVNHVPRLPFLLPLLAAFFPFSTHASACPYHSTASYCALAASCQPSSLRSVLPPLLPPAFAPCPSPTLFTATSPRVPLPSTLYPSRPRAVLSRPAHPRPCLTVSYSSRRRCGHPTLAFPYIPTSVSHPFLSLSTYISRSSFPISYIPYIPSFSFVLRLSLSLPPHAAPPSPSVSSPLRFPLPSSHPTPCARPLAYCRVASYAALPPHTFSALPSVPSPLSSRLLARLFPPLLTLPFCVRLRASYPRFPSPHPALSISFHPSARRLSLSFYTSTPSSVPTSALAFHLSFQLPARRVPLTFLLFVAVSTLLSLSLPPLRSSSSPLSSPAAYPPTSSITGAPSPALCSVIHAALAFACPISLYRLPRVRSLTLASTPTRQRKRTKWQSGRTGGIRAGAAARARGGAHRYARAASYFLQSALSVTYTDGGVTADPADTAAPDVGVPRRGRDADGEPQLKVGVVSVGVIPSADAEADEGTGGGRRRRQLVRARTLSTRPFSHFSAVEERRLERHFFRPRDQLIERASALARTCRWAASVANASIRPCERCLWATQRARDHRDRQGNVSRLLIPPPDAPVICELIHEGVLFSGWIPPGSRNCTPCRSIVAIWQKYVPNTLFSDERNPHAARAETAAYSPFVARVRLAGRCKDFYEFGQV